MSDILNVSPFGSDPVDDYVRRQILMMLAELWRSMDPVYNLSNEALVRLISRTCDQPNRGCVQAFKRRERDEPRRDHQRVFGRMEMSELQALV